MVAKFLGSLFGNSTGQQSVAEQLPSGSPAEDELKATAAALEELRRNVRSSGAQLPTVVYSRFRQLDDILGALIGYIEESTASTEQRVLLDAIITDYLPSPLRTYLMLPAASRLDDSRDTAVLLEQLGMLESTARNLDNQVRTGAITELAVHGRFLRDKFDLGSLHLEGS
ncbi:hypothetical protein [Arthrobacter cavernae]|uniref:Uncharacterized protein n=1 Tax=Arthrobacter cavernae TaxID=2817681 RepID=A0A939KJ46_9MICC|nr:hypothetical protein [Arthrobacter cavernae]MBO1268287.1 hypothetical protein [Arthrobacter cavernae]